MEKDFKLIAIRPLNKCDKSFRKILHKGVPYVFYNEYDFSNYSDKNRIVNVNTPNEPDLYSYRNSRNEEIKINISAIVGENGSGKSSIVELFYAACYNISVIKEVLFEENEKINRLLTSKDRVKNIHVEVFYKLNNELVLLKLSDNVITIFNFVNDRFVESKNEQLDLNKFFYTISINYSLHALNSNTLGIWVKKIFHKNDGYQTPIVLNPYRSEGNIEINNEEYLVKSRLISNILGKIRKERLIEDNLRNIIDKKVAHRLYVELKRDKFNYDKQGNPTFPLTEKHGNEILPLVYKYFLKNANFIPKETLLNKYAKEYIISKLKSIASKYDPYKRLFSRFYENDANDSNTEAYIQMLYEENSHVTFKLIQAINFLNNELYFNRKESFDLTVSYLSNQLEKESKMKGKELIDILPPAFFSVDIEFKEGDRFNMLSSGEKQRVYSISTLIYHLNNLSSTNSKTVLYKYNYVNIIFDELELYFHPELQRTLVNDILENIKKADLKNIFSINILFITHSPFILSDIPSNNILLLEKSGIPKKEGLKLETFGANIFDLLKHSFFLENGPMGEFAKNKITNTINWLNNAKRNLNEREQHKKIIQMIGEPILQIKLAEMFDIVTKEKTEIGIIEKKIADLQKELE